MKCKFFQIPSHHLAIAVIALALALACPDAPRAAGTPSCVDHYWNEHFTISMEAGREFAGAEFSLWRYYLWEPMPASWFETSTGAAILRDFNRRGWKPQFVGGDFRLNEAGRRLLSLVEGNQPEDDMSPAYHEHRDEILSLLNHLEELRLQPESYRPAFEALIDQLAAEHGENPCVFLHEVLPSFLTAASPSGLPPAALPIRSGMARLYDDLFRAAARLEILMLEVAWSTPGYLEKAPWRLASINGGPVTVRPSLQHLEYERFKEAITYYYRLAIEKPWIEVRSKHSLRLGDTGGPVAALQKRLHVEEFYQGKITGKFDETTENAVKLFQRRHMLAPDGVAGRRTLDWLNTPFDQKALLIETALRLRSEEALPDSERYIRINIPRYSLEYISGEQTLALHRVIVGKAAGKKVKARGRMVGINHTPTLSSQVQRIVFNPRWCVTERIRKELDDNIEEDPDYLAKNRFVPLSSTYPWGEPRICQLPGPTNPLGQVKFEFPNPYAVFAHDTTARHLFQKARRDFSHGCVRVENPVELAKRLLEDDSNPAAEKVGDYLKLERQTFVNLRHPVPIIIEYVPVFLDSDGHVSFTGDPYGLFGKG